LQLEFIKGQTMNLGLFFFGFLLFLTSLFMILIILVQRGRGGGLSGALGGSGGQSAFGAKAGDTFTRITVVTAIIWIALCMLTIKIFNPVITPTAAQTETSIGTGAGGSELPEVIDDGANILDGLDEVIPGSSGDVPPVVPGENADGAPVGDGADKGTEVGKGDAIEGQPAETPGTETPPVVEPAGDAKPADDVPAKEGESGDGGK
jgi:preprotein translocase subunit SecG